MIDDEAMRALLPWYLNNTLSDEERRQVEAWIKTRETIAEPDLALFQAVQKHMQAQAQPGTGDLGWQRLKRQLPTQSANTASRKRSPWLAPALAASLLTIALQTGWIIHLNQQAPDQAQWQTLSGSSENAATIQIIFQPNARFADIQTLLRTLNLRIVSGPSAMGVFRLTPTQTTDDLQTTVAQLKERPNLVQHAAVE